MDILSAEETDKKENYVWCDHIQWREGKITLAFSWKPVLGENQFDVFDIRDAWNFCPICGMPRPIVESDA